jgi:glycosyltransferase involved in cell wall biosynthesis
MQSDALSRITPVILTFNEAPNIERTLSALAWAREVIVVDSLSQDETEQIVRRFPNARFVQRAFDAHAAQWNFAIRETNITGAWILALDADYVVTAELVDELGRIDLSSGPAAYRTRFIYCVDGHRLRGSVYPPVTTLFRRGSGEYLQDGHTQRLVVDGDVGDLSSPILHDDRKPLSRWLASQNRYMELEAEKLAASRWGQLTVADRIRKLIFLAPPLVFFYSLVVRGAILDGSAGLYYATQRSIAEMILALHLLRRKLFR